MTPVVDVWGWMGGLVQSYGYAGAFLISIFGNFTIFFPVPFVITIYAFGATLNPLLLGLVCGLGSTVGEFSAYLVGMGGRRVINERYGEKLESAKILVQRHGMLVIFLFALLPLPDDLILIPLGMLRYDLRKALVAAFLGKVGMCVAVAYAGRYSFTVVRDLFESSGILGGVGSVVILAIIILALLRVDWAQFVNAQPKGVEEG
ncbi:MAG: VTT domain-containing protein [Candidatus Bathyarchaeota archaeon]|nr:MAG: VTT domain-containing protein [Candidatus Bathyarchaeota archaeon]